MDKTNRKLTILYKCIKANLSVVGTTSVNPTLIRSTTFISAICPQNTECYRDVNLIPFLPPYQCYMATYAAHTTN